MKPKKLFKFARKTANINVKNYSFITVCKQTFLQSRGRGYNKNCLFIHALDVTEEIFAVLCVTYGPYTLL